MVDAADSDRVYVMNVNIQVSDDGGRTFASLGTRDKHVDNHDIWIDPKNNNHYLVGCDGGLYESYDRASTWIFKGNLPTAQFYDVAIDEDVPFYHVYGGTQDNNSVGCAVRTRNTSLTNADCFVTNGGDGFYSRVDPKDPNTIYAASQNAGIVRFDSAPASASPSNRSRRRAIRRCAGIGTHRTWSVRIPIHGSTSARRSSIAATTAAIPGSRSALILRAS